MSRVGGGVNVIGGRPRPRPQRSAMRLPPGRVKDYGPLGAGIVSGSTAISDAIKELARMKEQRAAQAKQHGHELVVTKLREAAATERAGITADANRYSADVSAEASAARDLSGENIAKIGLLGQTATNRINLIFNTAKLHLESIFKRGELGLSQQRQELEERKFGLSELGQMQDMAMTVVQGERLIKDLIDADPDVESARVARRAFDANKAELIQQATTLAYKADIDAKGGKASAIIKAKNEAVDRALLRVEEFKGRYHSKENLKALMAGQDRVFDFDAGFTRAKGVMGDELGKLWRDIAQEDIPHRVKQSLQNSVLVHMHGIASDFKDAEKQKYDRSSWMNYFGKGQGSAREIFEIPDDMKHYMTEITLDKINDPQTVLEAKKMNKESLDAALEKGRKWAATVLHEPTTNVLEQIRTSDGTNVQIEAVKKALESLNPGIIKKGIKDMTEQNYGPSSALPDIQEMLKELGSRTSTVMQSTNKYLSGDSGLSEALNALLQPIPLSESAPVATTQPTDPTVPPGQPGQPGQPPQTTQPATTQPAEPDPNAEASAPGLSQDAFLQMQEAFNGGFPAQPFREEEPYV